MKYTSTESTTLFAQARPRLQGLAYRMLGSYADAEDAVQDTFLRWQSAAHEEIETPEAWLTAVCTRRCIDMLRAAHRTRVEYWGPWLPEPVIGNLYHESDTLELASSLSTAFLLLLERLTPTERAAYLLREIFDYDYRELADLLGKNQEACRKLVSRARDHITKDNRHYTPHYEQQQRLVDEFLQALGSGELHRLEALLAADVELWADGGGKATALPDILRDAAAVTPFLSGVWEKFWSGYRIEAETINSAPGLLLWEGETLVAAVTLAINADQRICGVYVVRNPDKLRLDA